MDGWTPEFLPAWLHEKIVDCLTSGFPANARPWAIFLVGGPGSSAWHCWDSLEQQVALFGPVGQEFCRIDVDKICDLLPTFHSQKASPQRANGTQAEAAYISDVAIFRCARTRRNFVVNACIRNFEDTVETMKHAVALSESWKEVGAIDSSGLLLPLRIGVVDVSASGDMHMPQHTGRVAEHASFHAESSDARESAQRVKRSRVVSLVLEVQKGLNGLPVLAQKDLSELSRFVQTRTAQHVHGLGVIAETIKTRLAVGVRTAKRPWAVWLAGGAGSGKGYCMRHILQECGIWDQRGVMFSYLDVDAQRKYLPAWIEDCNEPKLESTVQDTQADAGYLNDVSMHHCASHRKNFIIDGTMRNPRHAMRCMQNVVDQSSETAGAIQSAQAEQPLRRFGTGNLSSHRIAVVFVDTAVEVCLGRARKRAEVEHRPVQEDFVRTSNTDARESVAFLQRHSDMVELCIHVENNGEPLSWKAGSVAEFREFIRDPEFESRGFVRDREPAA